jgi:hypothetical protein
VLAIEPSDERVTPSEYPRAYLYRDRGAILLLPRRRGVEGLRMAYQSLDESPDGRVVAEGAVGTRVVLGPEIARR